ncbi:MAG: substrate-binding domain-containing protein [Anaerolineae bacterium]|nr:substrate-binding domain-containing protein [Anaerolineae bacterium]
MNRAKKLSRRNFLKASGALGMGLALSRGLPGLAAPMRQDTNLTMWWWGEQELPGLQEFVDESIANYSEATIDAMLQDTSVVISQFQTASAANEAPDIQYLWNGIYHMESVWFGYLEPVNGLVDDAVLEASTPTALSVYQGNTYRVGWYPLPMVWYYNKELYDQAGLDADNPPQTWDDLLDACDKLMTAGIAPIGGGIQDGFWGEWYLGHALVQNLDNIGQALDLFIGELDFREPQYYEHWSRLRELVDQGFINSEMASLELYPGIDLVVTGQLAMGESIGSRVPADNAAMNGNLGVMTMPVYGTGALAGKPIFDSQGLGISSQSENKEAAARFLEYLHTPERLSRFWELTGWLPSDTNFDTSVIEDETVKSMWDRWALTENIAYISNLTPGQFYSDAMVPAAQEIIAGTMNGEEAGELAARVVQEWRDFNPDLVENYKTWAEDLR